MAIATEPAAPGWRYGTWGFPVAFAALPLYVQLPAHYAQRFDVSLAALGAVLLVARGLDALIDPWLGRHVDRWLQAGPARLRRHLAVAGAAVGAGFAALFLPRVPTHPLLWCAVLVVPTTVAYSVASIAHQAWGARLGGGATGQARLIAWREGAALAGVLTASALPTLAGWTATSALLAATLLAGWWALQRLPLPTAPALTTPAAGAWQDRRFRALLGVFALNGIASAVPATLVLFFVADRLDAAAWAPLFLATYFLAAALALPAWVRLVPRLGLVGGWSAGMAVAVVAFAGAAALGEGDRLAFLGVCAVTGAALGADLVFPPALLVTTLPTAQAGGARFGWWQCVAKVNLAAAAGLALPLLEWGGYSPGRRTPDALATLTGAYCLLPCGLKVLALLALHRWRLRGV